MNLRSFLASAAAVVAVVVIVLHSVSVMRDLHGWLICHVGCWHVGMLVHQILSSHCCPNHKLLGFALAGYCDIGTCVCCDTFIAHGSELS